MEKDMSDSILSTIKHMIGPSEDYEYFDTDLIVHINSAFMRLTQLGVGPEAGFSISDSSAVWSDFVTDGRLEAVKQYVYFSVRLSFDPPANSSHTLMLKEQLDKLEWCLNVMAETPVFNS